MGFVTCGHYTSTLIDETGGGAFLIVPSGNIIGSCGAALNFAGGGTLVVGGGAGAGIVEAGVICLGALVDHGSCHGSCMAVGAREVPA